MLKGIKNMNGNNDLLGKFSNIYLMILFSISNQTIKDIKHYLSDDMDKKISDLIDEDIKNNERRYFDEANISKIDILTEEEYEDKIVLKVKVICQTMDYYVSLISGEFKRGENQRRIEKINILTFEKNKNIKEMDSVLECPYCGNSLSYNQTGFCSYCRKTIDMKNYDYILTNLEEVKFYK